MSTIMTLFKKAWLKISEGYLGCYGDVKSICEPRQLSMEAFSLMKKIIPYYTCISMESMVIVTPHV